MSNPANSSNELNGRMPATSTDTYGVPAASQAPKAAKRKRAGSYNREEGENNEASGEQNEASGEQPI